MVKQFLSCCASLVLLGCATSDRPIDDSERVFRGACRAGRLSKEPRTAAGATIQAVLDEANESFTYRSKAIHPGLIQEFQCWVSDLNPVTIAVDAAAALDANEYSSETSTRSGYLVSRSQDGDGEFGYQWRGRRSDGVHVVRTIHWSDGTAIFKSELWLRFTVNQGLDNKGHPYDRLVLELIRAQ